MDIMSEKIFIYCIEKLISKKGRKCSHSTKHYLDQISLVRNTGIQWKYLKGPLHFSTYYKKWLYWNSLKVFEKSYQLTIDLLYHNGRLNHDSLKYLSIDSSMVKNTYGSDNLGTNYFDRGRKGNKVSIISTTKGIPISVHVDRANIHDTKLAEINLNNLNVDIISSRRYPKYLIADKGYVSNDLSKKCKDKGLILITPTKKNRTNYKINRKRKELLSKRHIIENVFCWLDKYERIRTRRERSLENYKQFLYSSIVSMIAKKGLLTISDVNNYINNSK